MFPRSLLCCLSVHVRTCVQLAAPRKNDFRIDHVNGFQKGYVRMWIRLYGRLVTRAGNFLTRSGFPALVPQEKSSLSGHIIYPLLTKTVRSRWLDIPVALFFAFFFISTSSRSMKTRKKIKNKQKNSATLTT